MVKKKSRTIIQVPDGSGRMVTVKDKRFERGEWPVSVCVPAERANTWFTYFSAECHKRQWHLHGISQQDAKENSGSKTVTSQSSDQLDVVWERKRDGDLKIKARISGERESFLEEVKELFESVERKSSAGEKEQYFKVWHLCYHGLPWKGEFWLDDALRLSPPSLQYENALIGPRIVLVQALVDGIYPLHAGEQFQKMLRELSVFLSVVLGTHFQVSTNGRSEWTWKQTPSGKMETDVRNIEYWEKDFPKKMPTKGEIQSVPLQPLERPDFSLRGITNETELSLPKDTGDLWGAFKALGPALRQQFLQVGSMWQLALSLNHERMTTRFVLMAIACEALKPRDRMYWNHNIYNVVEALLSKSNANALREQMMKPQEIRNAHLHGGEFRGSEFIEPAIRSDFHDPTFDQACRDLYETVQAAIIAWLLRGGTFTMPPVERRKTWRRRLKDHALWLIPVVFILGLLIGAALM